MDNKSKIYIFSAGQIGRNLVDYYIDKKKNSNLLLIDNYKVGEYRGIKIISEKKLKKDKQVCIIGIYNHYISIKKTQDRLKKYFKKIVNIIDFKKQNKNFVIDYWLNSKNFLLNKNIIKNVSIHLADKKSKYLLERIFKFRLTGNIKYYIEPEKNIYFSFKQLIPKKINIIDCGSYKGEFIDILLKQKFKIKKAICFEPDKKSFIGLKKKFFKFNNIKVMNRVLGSSKDYVGFEGLGNSASKINTKSNFKIKTFSFKNKFKNEKIDLVKIDIEGSELNLLKQSTELILNQNPILFICVYHYYRDIPDILKFMSKFKSIYKFYLRVHEENTFGVVLYCIPK